MFPYRASQFEKLGYSWVFVQSYVKSSKAAKNYCVPFGCGMKKDLIILVNHSEMNEQFSLMS